MPMIVYSVTGAGYEVGRFRRLVEEAQAAGLVKPCMQDVTIVLESDPYDKLRGLNVVSTGKGVRRVSVESLVKEVVEGRARVAIDAKSKRKRRRAAQD